MLAFNHNSAYLKNIQGPRGRAGSEICYVSFSRNCDWGLGSDNLLFIAQFLSDKQWNLKFYREFRIGGRYRTGHWRILGFLFLFRN